MIWKFLLALWDHVKHMQSCASLETTLWRGVECMRCEQRTGDDRCRICGCLFPIKITWADASCPLEKWGMEEEHATRTTDP